jgi:aspartyl/asparaginyl beta-hydroxylase (cupin superfamily)
LLRTALFSRLGPQTTLSTHQGWAQLSNHVLRCHLALSVPSAGAGGEGGEGGEGAGMRGALQPPCGLVVGDEIRFHAAGEVLVFDDSLMHSAFNLHASEARVVLIFDVARPAGAAPGSAEKGKTEELEAFIREFH